MNRNLSIILIHNFLQPIIAYQFKLINLQYIVVKDKDLNIKNKRSGSKIITKLGKEA